MNPRRYFKTSYHEEHEGHEGNPVPSEGLRDLRALRGDLISSVSFRGGVCPRPVLALGVAGAFFALGAWAAETNGLTWFTDLPKAEAQAKAEGKFVLLFFHGSDWCPPCVEMQRQVIDSSAFASYARQAVVLVDVDFPEKHPTDDAQRRNNLALKARFNLSPEPGEGFPTLVLLNEAGETVYQETGYGGGGVAEVLPKLQAHAGSKASSAAGAGFKNLTVAEFAQLAGDKQNVILDVRTEKEFAAGHLQGAVNLDINAPDFEAKTAALDKGKVYLVHCASGVRSARACEKLVRLDFHALYNLPGGYNAWVKAGLPTEP